MNLSNVEGAFIAIESSTSVSYTGSLGPSSRDTRVRVGPMGQPHLPARQMNGG